MVVVRQRDERRVALHGSSAGVTLPGRPARFPARAPTRRPCAARRRGPRRDRRCWQRRCLPGTTPAARSCGRRSRARPRPPAEHRLDLGWGQGRHADATRVSINQLRPCISHRSSPIQTTGHADDRRRRTTRCSRAARRRWSRSALVSLEFEGGAVEACDREAVAFGEVDLDHLDVVSFERLTTVGEPALMITLPGERVTPLSARSQYSSTGTSMIV